MKRRKPSPYEYVLRAQIDSDPELKSILGHPIPEFGFAVPKRWWRFDFAWLGPMLALEIDGGVWTQGRHVRGKGFLGDREKMNEATLLGWFVFHVTPEQLERGEAITLLRRALHLRVPMGTR